LLWLKDTLAAEFIPPHPTITGSRVLLLN